MMIDEFGKIIIHQEEVKGILRFSCCFDNNFLNP